MHLIRDFQSTSRLGAQYAGVTPFDPATLVSSWLRLQASTQSGGEWTNWVDVMNSNPAVPQTGRLPAVETSANGLPVAFFAGATFDAMRWPLITATNGQAKYGFWARIKPTSIASTQYIYTVNNDAGGASAQKCLLLMANPGTLIVGIYQSNFNDYTLTSTGTVFSTSAYTSFGFTYDRDAGPTNADRLKVFAGGAYISTTASGAATLGTLPAPTGNAIINNFKDDGAGNAMNGRWGPNVFILSGGHLTTAQLAALEAFEAPT